MKTEKITWYTCPHGDYHIKKTRFGTFNSYDRDNKGLVCGPTEEVVHMVTRHHLERVANEDHSEEKKED